VIVTCERCATQFKLDDERVPSDGVRVRCSRCKHAFFIEPPVSESEQIHRIARRALEEDETPAVSEDLSAPTEAEAPVGGDADEEDWEFADGLPEPDDDESRDGAVLQAARDAVDDLLATDPEPPVAPMAEPPVPEADHSAGFSADQLGLEEGDEEAPLALEGEEDLAPEAEDDLFDFAEMSAPAPASPAAEPDADSSDLAQDLLGGEDLDVSPSPPAPPQSAPTPRSVPEVESAAATPAVAPNASDELGDLDDWGLLDAPAEEERPAFAPPAGVIAQPLPEAASMDLEKPAPRRLALLGSVGGWAAVIALLAFGLHGGISLQPSTRAEAPATLAVGGFRIDEVETRWIDSVRSGPLLVVSGRVWNEEPDASQELRVNLLDANGAPLDAVPIPLGVALSDAELREGDAEVFRRARTALRTSGGLPGEIRTFHAVVTGLPGSAAHFRFSAVASKPPPVAPADATTAREDAAAPSLEPVAQPS
jgi:predicted Zn finger-like uncharacterized protein